MTCNDRQKYNEVLKHTTPSQVDCWYIKMEENSDWSKSNNDRSPICSYPASDIYSQKRKGKGKLSHFTVAGNHLYSSLYIIHNAEILTKLSEWTHSHSLFSLSSFFYWISLFSYVLMIWSWPIILASWVSVMTDISAIFLVDLYASVGSGWTGPFPPAQNLLYYICFMSLHSLH